MLWVWKVVRSRVLWETLSFLHLYTYPAMIFMSRMSGVKSLSPVDVWSSMFELPGSSVPQPPRGSRSIPICSPCPRYHGWGESQESKTHRQDHVSAKHRSLQILPWVTACNGKLYNYRKSPLKWEFLHPSPSPPWLPTCCANGHAAVVVLIHPRPASKSKVGGCRYQSGHAWYFFRRWKQYQNHPTGINPHQFMKWYVIKCVIV